MQHFVSGQEVQYANLEVIGALCQLDSICLKGMTRELPGRVGQVLLGLLLAVLAHRVAHATVTAAGDEQQVT